MMLCVDKKMLHDSLPDHESGQLPAGAENGRHGVREYQRDGHGGPVSVRDQHRREVLLRVVRISDTLNQRLAL